MASPNYSHLTEQAAEIAASGDYFYQDLFLDPSLSASPSQYFKRDFLFREGLWRGKAHGPISRNRKVKQLFIGHSDLDFSLRDWRQLSRSARAQRIFATNLSIHPTLWNLLRVTPLPIGLTNPTRESSKHEILGDSQMIAAVAGTRHERSQPELYSNYDPHTSPPNRQYLSELVEGLPFVRKGKTDHSRLGRGKYLAEMRDSGLVLCPAGNGNDTHRLYEALLVGALPVVLRNSYQAIITRFYRLPSVQLESWTELRDPQRVVEKAAESLRSPFSLKFLRGSYWIEIWKGTKIRP